MLENAELRAEAAAILEAIYEERGDWEKLIDALEILARAEGDVERARRAPAQDRAHLRARARATSRARSTRWPRRSGRSVARRDARRDRAHRRRRPSAWRQLVALYERDRREPHRRARSRASTGCASPRSTSALGEVDEAAKGYAHVLCARPGRRRGARRARALFTRTERWTDLIGVVERRIEQRATRATREALYGADGADLRRAPRPARGRRRRVQRGARARPGEPRARSRALDALFTRQKMWSELAENLEAQLALAAERRGADRAHAPPRGAARDARWARSTWRSRATARCSSATPTNAQALAALERLGSDAEVRARRSPTSSSRSIGRSATTRSSSASTRCRCAAATTPTRRVELLHQIAQLYEDAAGDLELGVRHARARARGGPGERGDAAAARSRRARDRPLRRSRAASSRSSRAQHRGRRRSRSALYDDERARLRERPRRRRHGDRALPQGARDRPAQPRRGRVARAPLPHDRALPGALAHPPAQGGDPRGAAREEGRALPGRGDRRGRPRAARGGDRRLQEGPRDRRATTSARIDALIKRYLGLSRWAGSPRASTRRRPTSSPTPTRRSASTTRSAPSTSASSATCRRRSTRTTKILELDPDDLQALVAPRRPLRAGAELAGAPQRPHARERDDATTRTRRSASSTGSPSSTRSTSTTSPRAIELYREILQQQPDHAPTLDALEGLKSGDKDPLGAAAVLEPVYEAASDWPKLISVHEVQVTHADDPFQKVELLHRIARLYEDALDEPRVGVRHVRARARRSTTATRRRSQNLERLAMVVNRWPRRRGALRRGARQARRGRRSASSSSGSASRRSSRCSSRTSTARSRATAASLEVDAENQTAVRALDRLFTQTERWAELARDPRARGRDRPDARRDPRVQVPPRPGAADAPQRPRRGHRRVPRRPHRRARAHGDARGPRGALRERREADRDRRDPRAALPRVGRVGEARRASTRRSSRTPHRAQRGAPRDVLPHRRAPRRASCSIALDGALDVYIRALKEYPARREDGRGSAAPRRRASTAAGRRSPTRTPTSSACTPTRTSSARSASASRATFEDELGDISKAEETYRYVLGVEPLDAEALANLDRIYLSLEPWPELAQHPRAARPGDDRRPRAGRALRAPRRGLRGRASATLDDAIRAFRRIFDELDKTHEARDRRARRASTSSRARGPSSTSSTSASSRTRPATSPEAEIRAKIAHLARRAARRRPQRAIETWKRVLDLRGEDPEALGALANLYERSGQWAELVDVLERAVRHRGERRRSRQHPHAARAHLHEQAQPRRLGARGLEPRPRHRLREPRGAPRDRRRSGAAQSDPNELVTALHQMVDRAAAMLDAEELKEIFRELGKTYGEQLAAAVRRGRRVAEAPRGRPRLRGDGRARGDLPRRRALDRRHRRQDAARRRARGAGREDRRVPSRSPRSGARQVGEPDRRRPAYEKILEIDPTHDEAFLELEKLHTAAGRWEPLVELYLARLETREETREKTRPPPHASRASSRRSSTTRTRRSTRSSTRSARTSTIARRRATSSAWRRPRALGRGHPDRQRLAASSRRSRSRRSASACTSPSGTATTSATPSTRSRTTRRSSQLDPNNVGALRQMASLYREERQLAAARRDAHARARRRGHRRRSQGDPDRARRAARRADEPDRSGASRTSSARSRSTRTSLAGAREPRAHLRGARSEPRARRRPHAQGARRSPSPTEIAATSCASAALYETSARRFDRARRRSTARCSRSTPSNLARAARPRARLRDRSSSGRSSCSVLETQLDVVTTERERIDVLMQLAQHPGGALPQARHRGPAARAGRSRSIRTTRRRYVALERCYRQLRQWLDLINTYERHITATLERQDEGRALRRTSRRSTPTRSRTSIARSTPTATSSTSTTRTSPRSKRSRSSTRSRATRRSPSTT